MHEFINLPMNEIIGTLLNYASIALFVIATLTALTNIVVEVFKDMPPQIPLFRDPLSGNFGIGN
jgi:hypothetical protein